jgi:hypothetical protein
MRIASFSKAFCTAKSVRTWAGDAVIGVEWQTDLREMNICPLFLVPVMKVAFVVT